MDSSFGNPFLFLTDLAWKIRVALPALILVSSMVFDIRWEIEINITTERIPLQDGEPRRDDDLYYDDDDDEDNDDDDNADAAVDDDDEDEPNGGGAGPGVNGTIRISRYAIVNIHNVRR
ncbi:calsequestrin-1 [Anopheles aquasalis]|uniref:calsequestrin-1 n=1 Tax=Anopheles aquasalis TaxID=42839 RepID=UPI00215ACE74|nr:calsequestrin-1 [Anopheles aquasalis]